MEKRDAFDTMLRASRVEYPPVRGIVVWKMNCLSRNELEARFHTADFRLSGFQVVSISCDIPQGEFVDVVEAFIRLKDQRFLHDLQGDVMRGLDSVEPSEVVVDGVARRGFSGGGFPPKGYDARRVEVGVKKSGKPQFVTYWVKTEDPDLRARVELAWKIAVDNATSGCQVEVAKIHAATRLYPTVSCNYDFFRSITYAEIRKVGERRVTDAHELYVAPEPWDLVQSHLPGGGSLRCWSIPGA